LIAHRIGGPYLPPLVAGSLVEVWYVLPMRLPIQ